MTELIKVSKNANNEQVVSARELHQFLEAGSNVNTWFKNQVERAMLQEGIDFIQINEESTGGRPSIDYVISLQSAKEIAMLNGGEKGKQARLYFIECEKQLKNNTPSYLIEDRIARAQQYIREEQERVELAKQLKLKTEHLEVATELVDKLIHAPQQYTITQVAKELGISSAIILNNFLHQKKIQYKQSGTWMPYSKYVDAQLFVLKQTVLKHKSGEETIKYYSKLTGTGRLFVINLYQKSLINNDISI